MLKTDHLADVIERQAPKASPTSYPFLALARVRNVPYRDVLEYADYCAWCYGKTKEGPPDRIPGAVGLDQYTRVLILDHVTGVRDIATEVPRIAR